MATPPPPPPPARQSMYHARTTPPPPAAVHRRGLDRSAWFAAAALLPSLPASLLGLGLLSVFAQSVIGLPPAVTLTLLVLWALAPLAPAMTPVLASSLGVQRPTPAQQQRLVPAWSRVLARSGQGATNRYRLYVEPGDHLNAYAVGGWLVAVTEGALSLPDDELEAILAHELGHHLGGHLLVSSLERLLFAPVQVLQFALAAVWWLVAALTNVSWFLGLPGVNLVAFVLALLLRAVAFVLTGLIVVAHLLRTWAGRQGEFLADERAAALGYAKPLARSLARMADDEQEPGGATAIERALHATHPPIRERIARL